MKKKIEKWNENVEECSECGIKWKKIGKSCPVCFAPAETPSKIGYLGTAENYDPDF